YQADAPRIAADAPYRFDRQTGAPTPPRRDCAPDFSRNSPGRLVRHLVAARLRPERDRNTVPAVDGDDGQRQVHDLRFAEVLAHGVKDVIRHVSLMDEGERLGPFEC